MNFFDFETQSGIDLAVCGSRNYASHESTRILTMVSLIGGTYHCWSPVFRLNPDWIRPEKLTAPIVLYNQETFPPQMTGDMVHVAHNAFGFDKMIWEQKLGNTPAEWLDTMILARKQGYPGSLDELGKRLLGVSKHKGGDTMKRIMKAEWDGDKWIYKGKVGQVQQVMQYNIQDVWIMEQIYHKLDVKEDPLLPVHLAINARGVKFDFDLARQICLLSDQDMERAGEEITRISGLTKEDLRSIPKMTAWLKSKGVFLENLQKDTVERFLNEWEDVDPIVPEVLELRNAFLKITKAKMEKAGRYLCPDGRLRDAFILYGAHTHRFTSKGVQVHNLTKGDNIGPVDTSSEG